MKKISILTNTNLEPLAKKLKQATAGEVYHCPYNHHLLDLINTQSPLYTHPPELLFIYLDSEEFFAPELTHLPSAETFATKTDEYLSYLEAYAKKYPQTSIIFTSFAFMPFPLSSFLEGNSANSFMRTINEINQKAETLSQRISNMNIFNINRLFQLHGHNTLIDEKYWYLSRFKFSAQGLELVTEELKSLISAIEGKTKKVLVLDLDNVLWGGIIGEDGVDGVELSEDGIGKIYRDFQMAVKSLQNIGVLLAINSKNNEADVLNMFNTHPMIVLKYDDFAAKRINWNNKAQNMIEIANELNIGLDSLVFIDDTAAERELIKQQCPQVTVPEFPNDVAYLRKWLLNDIVHSFFGKIKLTQEDLDKTQQYARNNQRQSLAQKVDMNDYIKQLNIRLTVHKNPVNLKTRLAQLTQKTNQFNMTTRRYTDADIATFIGDKNYHVYGLEYEDTFGKEGIIATAIVKNKDKNTASLDTFLMSCRVIGRRVEDQFMRNILNDLGKQNISTLEAEFIPTAKNSLAADFYKTYGFNPLGNNYYKIFTKEMIPNG